MDLGRWSTSKLQDDPSTTFTVHMEEVTWAFHLERYGEYAVQFPLELKLMSLLNRLWFMCVFNSREKTIEVYQDIEETLAHLREVRFPANIPSSLQDILTVVFDRPSVPWTVARHSLQICNLYLSRHVVLLWNAWLLRLEQIPWLSNPTVWGLFLHRWCIQDVFVKAFQCHCERVFQTIRPKQIFEAWIKTSFLKKFEKMSLSSFRPLHS